MPFLRHVLIAAVFGPLAFSGRAQGFTYLSGRFITDSARITALVDATVIDGTGSPSKKHRTIVIENGVITRLGMTGAVAIPAGAAQIDCSGKTIIPGMVIAARTFLLYHADG